MQKKYSIKYLPSVKKDIQDIVDYISVTLEAPQAALRFIDELEKSILGLQKNPFAHRLYQPLKPIDTEYRILTVKNYLVFYIVLPDIVEIHRVVYKRRDLQALI